MTDREALRAARDLISDPEHWTTYALARNAAGDPTLLWAADVVSFCVSGAICRYADQGSTLPMRVSELALERHGLDLIDLNDRGGHAAVMAFLDRAVDTDPRSC